SQTLAYYRARAPEQLTFPQADEAPGEPPVRFRKETLPLDLGIRARPEIAHLHWTRLAADEDAVLLACDMRHGQVAAIDLGSEERQSPRILARLRNPCRVEVCDLDDDGATDLVVADLGSYLPADHDRGRVVLLKRRQDSRDYETIELATGLGRVADVRAADLDGNGRLDLIVAEFGWHQTGGILWLRNVSPPGGPPRFEPVEIDDRPGAIHVPVHDFNGDGRPDFAALVSQQYETIDLFLNAGRARFTRDNLWAGPDLTFGSSGIELVDLNQDGATDVLYTNGDAFDNSYVSPWHGVGWLENRGGLEFVHHRLTDLPGAYRALAEDFDRDGDQDVVVVAWLPPDVRPASVKASPPASIVFLEQTGPGAFSRHTLERGAPHYATLAIGDFDGDGDPDFAVASGPNLGEARQQAHSLTVWWNRTIARD
ncbi:MAG: FG-GAP repeat domain-containing protein, partial [Planctomycetaceae bacterium]